MNRTIVGSFPPDEELRHFLGRLKFMWHSSRINRLLIPTLAVPGLLLFGCASEPRELSWTPPPDGEPTRLAELPLTDVTIDDAFWSPRIETNRTRTLPHTLAQLEEVANTLMA